MNNQANNQDMLDLAPKGATHVSEGGGNYYKEVPCNKRCTLHELFIWCGLGQEWMRPKQVRSIRSLADIRLIVGLNAKLSSGSKT